MENTESGSLGGNSGFDSLLPTENGGAGGGVAAPGATPTIVGASINVESNAGVTTSAAAAVGGGIMVTGQTMGGGIISNGGGEMTWKKRRGRPRKYELDGSIRPGYLKSPPPSNGTMAGKKRKSGGSPDPGSWSTPASLGGGHFRPHVITANTGEDVAAKILTFAQKVSRGGVCVLSANGTVSNATIRQPCSSGGLLTYEGRFEILSLMGSYTVCEEEEEEGGVRSRNGGLSVMLGGSDGRVIGGGVAGVLMAATPTQIVVGCFEPNKPQFSAAAAPILSQTPTPNSGACEADQTQPPCNVSITDYN